MVCASVRHFAAFSAALMMLSGGSSASTVQSRILQYRFDRLYFSSGTEANVFAGSPFVVTCGGDTVHTGRIAKSLLGISTSDTTGSRFVAVDWGRCVVWIDAAVVDSTAPILLATLGFHPATLIWRAADSTEALPSRSVGADGSVAGFTVFGNSIRLAPYARHVDLVYQMQRGELDGFFSFRSHPAEWASGSVIDAPAPFVAVLMPLGSRALGHPELYTASLYYRFSEAQLPVLFDGDRVTLQTSLQPGAIDGARPHPHSPEQGRLLLSGDPHRPKRLRLAATDESLSEMMLYFADILARDRIEIELVTVVDSADILLAYIPFDDTAPQVTLRHLCDVCRPAGRSQQDAIEAAQGYLIAAEAAVEPEERDQHLRLAEQELIHEVGVYPLFRPRVYFHAAEKLRDCYFDHGGFFGLEFVTKLRLPVETTEAP